MKTVKELYRETLSKNEFKYLDNLMDVIDFGKALAEHDKEILIDNDKKYHELLLAVGRKFTNETRHETALRYIQEAEANVGDEDKENKE